MQELIIGAGIFIYPLVFCSVAVVFILAERLCALRRSRVMPQGLFQLILKGGRPEGKAARASVGGRIADFFFTHKPDPEGLKAYASLEVSRLERGLFILEIVIAGAPLLGLLGTVTGLIHVFGNYTASVGAPDASLFVEGIALALTTTMLGLIIALPALVGHTYLLRRIDLLGAELNLAVERLVQITPEA